MPASIQSHDPLLLDMNLLAYWSAEMFRSLLPDHFQYEFFDGEHEYPAAEGCADIFPGPYYAFYPVPTTMDVELAHQYVAEIIEDEGPFDAVMGFSQGAALAASILLRHEKEKPLEPAPFRLAVFICGSLPYWFEATQGVDVAGLFLAPSETGYGPPVRITYQPSKDDGSAELKPMARSTTQKPGDSVAQIAAFERGFNMVTLDEEGWSKIPSVECLPVDSDRGSDSDSDENAAVFSPGDSSPGSHSSFSSPDDSDDEGFDWKKQQQQLQQHPGALDTASVDDVVQRLHPSVDKLRIGIPTAHIYGSKDPYYPQGLPVRTLYQAAPYTFLENLAVRQNGSILTTRLDDGYLLEVDPYSGQGPQTVHVFSEYLAVGGIVETEPDLFAVVAGNFSVLQLTSYPGTYAVWTVDYRASSRLGAAPLVSKLADVPEAHFIDGVTYVPSAHSLYLGDADLGVIYKLDMHSGKYYVAINDTLARKCLSTDFEGINGLKYLNSHLYWTNSGCGYYAKLPLDFYGNPVGNASLVLDDKLWLDDFAFAPDGTAYHSASFINQIISITQDGKLAYVAGDLNSSAVAQPTAVAFGRTPEDLEKGTIYVTTAGAIGDPINGTTVVGAQLLAIDTKSSS
ncbi:hypothetical protein DV737_g3017, partial [Chaetothyriales sp. CBS 132003]